MKHAVVMLLASFAGAAGAAPNRADLERAAEIAAARHQVPAQALKSICTRESNWNPAARGAVGEIGLCQIRPTTALQMHGAEWRRDLTRHERLLLIERELYDPMHNLDVAARYLAWMMREADCDIDLAIAGYNAGPGVIRYVRRVRATMQQVASAGGGRKHPQCGPVRARYVSPIESATRRSMHRSSARVMTLMRRWRRTQPTHRRERRSRGT